MDADDMTAPLVSEIWRILGDVAPVSDGPKRFLLLPLLDDADALAFLRTVPTGTPLENLLDLAVAYRAAHPKPTGSV